MVQRSRSIGVAARRQAGKGGSIAAITIPVCTTLPQLANPLTAGVQQAITAGAWTLPSGTITLVGWRLLDDGVDYRNALNTAGLYTPEQARVGHSIVVREEVVWSVNNQTYYGVSVARTIVAAAPPFVANQIVASSTFIQNTAITPYTPVTASGRPGPLRLVSVTPALPASLSVVKTASGTPAANEGEVSGTPTGTQGSTSYTFLWHDDSTGDEASNTTAITINAAAAQPLDPLPRPEYMQVSDFSGSYDGVNALDDGTYVHLGPTTVGGVACDIRRIKQSFTSVWGGKRSESSWSINAYRFQPARDYWMAFAFQIKSDEPMPATSQYDPLLIFQTHTPCPGATQPDLALFLSKQTNVMTLGVAYQSDPPNADGSQDNNAPNGGAFTRYSETMPAAGSWVRCVIHYRPGYLSSHNPLVELWFSVAGETWRKVLTWTGLNTYNVNNNTSLASYPRIGPYKWDSSNWQTPSNPIAFYTSRLYWGEGADLLARAQASVDSFV